MKVLHFYKTYHPDTFGGAEQAIQQICMATAKLGIENTLLVLSPKAQPSEFWSPMHRVVRVRRQMKLASMDIAFGAVKKFRQLALQADVVHVHYPWPFMDLVLLASGCNKPIVVTYHSDIIRQKWLRLAYAPLERWLLAKANRIVATSPNYLATSVNLRMYLSKAVSVPLAIDDTSYPKSLGDRLPSGLKSGKYFLFVGMLRYYKGLDSLIQAAATMTVPIVIAGEGPEEAALRRLAQQCKANNVIFLGRVSESLKITLLANCLSFVFPSNQRSEAFGVALLEAAMLAKPMITCEIGTGTSFVNRHEVTGLVVEPDNPLQLAQAMHRLANDEPFRARLAAAAKQRYNDEFTAEKMGAAYVEIYRKTYERS